MIENNRIEEAKAWVKKYFNLASYVYKLLDFIHKGMKDKRLISNPIHTLNQEEEEILIIVPINKEAINNIL
jgi:hypothetical protein